MAPSRIAVLWALAGVASAGRVRHPLDGSDWQFSLSSPAQTGMIRVPGAWEAQHYGQETDTMRWQVLTGDQAGGGPGAVGVYSKRLANNSCPAAAPRAMLCVDHGVHRTASFRIDGRDLGEHNGYLTPFEADISPEFGRAPMLTIKLDGGRNKATDPLMGASDLDTDGTGLGGWAGINGHVYVECRPTGLRIDSGVAGVLPPWVTHSPVSSDEPQTVELQVQFKAAGGAGRAVLEIRDAAGTKLLATAQGGLTNWSIAGSSLINVSATLQPWSPENPQLYTASITLLHPDGSPADSASTRFGVRTISTDGYAFKLNGRRLFLSGYGDDSVYPHTVAPPRDRAVYDQKLKFARSHGFNFVRHHSSVLPDEYFDSADEHGMLVSPEMPCAYGQYYDAANAAGQQLYTDTWTSYIQRLRNHPSVMDWAMCNEYAKGILQRQQLYDIAKQLDPTRLVIDAGGLFGWQPGPAGPYARGTLDFHSIQFDVNNLGAYGAIALDAPNKYHDLCSAASNCSFKTAPAVPAISHETGNFNTFPRLDALITRFNDSGTTIKPYWLVNARKHLDALGLLDENDAWATATERLYAMCWKLDIEDLLRNRMMSGYEWWTIQDFWTGNNGVVDTFFTPKSAVAATMTQFNGPVVLLQEGLELAYHSGDTLNVTLSVSNYGLGALSPGSHSIAWHVSQCTAASCTATSNGTSALLNTVPQGELGHLIQLSVKLPDLGTTSSPEPVPPATIMLQATISGQTALTTNSWNSTIYPKWVDAPTSGFNITVTDPALLNGCMFSNCQAADPSFPHSVYLTQQMNEPLLDAVRAGSVAVLLQQDSKGFYPSEATRFKQAWWLGSSTDNNAGTYIYDHPSGVFDGMAPLNYADVSWYRMIEGAQAFLLEQFDQHDSPDVLVRAIDIVGLTRNKALAFKMQVGRGWLLGVGLNLYQDCTHASCPHKEKAWVLHRLLSHGAQLMK